MPRSLLRGSLLLCCGSEIAGWSGSCLALVMRPNELIEFLNETIKQGVLRQVRCHPIRYGSVYYG